MTSKGELHSVGDFSAPEGAFSASSDAVPRRQPIVSPDRISGGTPGSANEAGDKYPLPGVEHRGSTESNASVPDEGFNQQGVGYKFLSKFWTDVAPDDGSVESSDTPSATNETWDLSRTAFDERFGISLARTTTNTLQGTPEVSQGERQSNTRANYPRIENRQESSILIEDGQTWVDTKIKHTGVLSDDDRDCLEVGESTYSYNTTRGEEHLKLTSRSHDWHPLETPPIPRRYVGTEMSLNVVSHPSEGGAMVQAERYITRHDADGQPVSTEVVVFRGSFPPRFKDGVAQPNVTIERSRKS